MRDSIGLKALAEILLVEDDLSIAAFIQRGLAAEGHAVELAVDGREGLDRARARRHPLIILDRMLPILDGMSLCRALRAEDFASMVLMLTAKDDLHDRIEGLKGGADDYLGKPFAFDELLARIEALLRRSHQNPRENPILQVADLLLNTATKRARRGDRAISLTAKEYALLEYLMRNSGSVVSRSRLFSGVWGLGFDPGTKVIDVYVSYLRRKIDAAGETPLIGTVRGFGYTIGGADPNNVSSPVGDE